MFVNVYMYIYVCHMYTVYSIHLHEYCTLSTIQNLQCIEKILLSPVLPADFFSQEYLTDIN